MRILLAALHAPGGKLPYGGVQSWISTVAHLLTDMGHSVTVWGLDFKMPQERFELGIFAHRRVTKYAMPLCETISFVSHGVIDEEAPGDGLTFYTSEEVAAYWKADGPIIRQPIDLTFWKPKPEPKRKTLVFYSYRAKGCFGLDALSTALGLEFVWLRDVEAQEARSVLQDAALVCASGRASIEAMACNAPTIICDWRDYNGSPLICQDMDKARAHNYSGRGGVQPDVFDVEQFARETMAFQRPREYVENYHDAEKVTKELLAACLQS